MYSARPEDKIVLVMDADEVLNYQNFLEHLPNLVNMSRLASMPTKAPRIAAELAKFEEYYGIKASSIAVPNVPLVDAAFQTLQRLQAQGRIATVSDPSRFKYPSHRADIEEEMKEAFQFSSKNGQEEPETPTSPNTAVSPKLSFTALDTDIAEEERLREAREADAERKRREQQKKQEKAAQKKEEEAQRLKAILEQAEKDKAERSRLEEEAKVNRAVEAAQAAQQLESAASASNNATGLQVPSVSPSNSSPSSPKSTSPRKQSYAAVASTGTTPADTTYRSAGHWAASSSSTSAAAAASSSSSTSQRGSASSAPSPANGFARENTGVANAEPTVLPSDNLAYYVQLLRKLESESLKANNMLKTLSLLKLSNPGNPEIDAAHAKWVQYAENLNHDHNTVTEAMRQDMTGVGRSFGVTRATAVPPPTSAGFTLGSMASEDDDEEEISVAGVALVMVDGAPLWRVRVTMPTGPIVLNINPSHTVSDLISHLATLHPITTRFKLEIVGKPGALELGLTAEQAGLKNTALRLAK